MIRTCILGNDMNKLILTIGLSLFLFTVNCFAISHNSYGIGEENANAEQSGNTLKFEKNIHNFGKIYVNDGAVTYAFKFKNTGSKPVAIYNVLSSCGCTVPEWPKKPIAPGASGELKVTFNNDQGAYPFDKSLTVYTSASSKPIILRIIGIVLAKGKTLSQLYPIKIGSLGVQQEEYNHGRIFQGDVANGQLVLANLSKSKVLVKSGKLSPGLIIKSISPNPIPAESVATLQYTINTKAKNNWGNVIYSAELLSNGAKSNNKLLIHGLITDDYTALSKDELNSAPLVLCENNSEYLTVKKGSVNTLKFSIQNIGKNDLIIRKAEVSSNNVSSILPKPIKAGAKSEFAIKIDNRSLDAGEYSYTITLITNCPTRPLVLFFITCTLT